MLNCVCKCFVKSNKSVNNNNRTNQRVDRIDVFEDMIFPMMPSERLEPKLNEQKSRSIRYIEPRECSYDMIFPTMPSESSKQKLKKENKSISIFKGYKIINRFNNSFNDYHTEKTCLKSLNDYQKSIKEYRKATNSSCDSKPAELQLKSVTILKSMQDNLLRNG